MADLTAMLSGMLEQLPHVQQAQHAIHEDAVKANAELVRGIFLIHNDLQELIAVLKGRQ